MSTFQMTGHGPIDEETVGHLQDVKSFSAGVFSREVISSSDESLRTVIRQPVVYEGEMPVFYPSEMVPGVAYDFSVYGKPVLAIKELDGNVNLYYIAE